MESIQEYWNKAMAYYGVQDVDTRAFLFSASIVAAIATGLVLLRVMFWAVAWVTSPLRTSIARDTVDTDAWAAMERQQIMAAKSESEQTDDEDVEDDDALTLAIEKLGEAVAQSMVLTDAALKTIRDVTDQMTDTVERALKTIERTARQNRRTVETAVAAASPFVTKPESKPDDDDDEE